MNEKVLLIDSSFVMAVAELGSGLLHSIDEMFGPITKATIKQVVNELSKISKVDTKHKSRKARLALKLIERMKIIPSNPRLKTDEAILELATKQNLIVATTDSDLIKKLKKMNIPVIYIKNNFLKLNGLILR